MHQVRQPAIALEICRIKSRYIRERFGHLREEDMLHTPGAEDELIERLRTLLFMARRAVVDLIRGA